MLNNGEGEKVFILLFFHGDGCRSEAKGEVNGRTLWPDDDETAITSLEAGTQGK